MTIKEQLFHQCYEYIDQRIGTAKAAIESAKASADEETKSSAGDKYETGRAMMQLEMEKHNAQLAEASKLRKMLDQIQPHIHKQSDSVQPGSAVDTDQGSFFIAISAGQLKAGDKVFFAISPATPIATPSTRGCAAHRHN